MQPQLEATREVSEYLNSNNVTYFVIGGIANAVWGKPRATDDADFKIPIENQPISYIVNLINKQFKFRVSDPLAFAQQTYVLPVYASNGVEVDICLGFLPYEHQAANRSVITQQQGINFLVCTAEDLIIQKAVSVREKDWEDISGVLKRQGKNLDQNYIAFWLNECAESLERPEIIQRYEKLKQKLQIH